MHRNQYKIHGGAFLKAGQDLQKSIAVLAPGHAYHDAISRRDHIEILNSHAGKVPEPFQGLVGIVKIFSFIHAAALFHVRSFSFAVLPRVFLPV